MVVRKSRDKKSKNVWLFGSSSLSNDIGSEMIAPILPFYISALGGGGVAIGLFSGLREGLASLFKVLGGWLSDRVGKRMPFVFFGYFTSILFRFLLAIAKSWQLVLGFVSFERLGKIRDSPRDAVVSDSSKRKGKGFGILQTMDSIGSVIGTIIVLLLLWKFGLEFKTIILIAAGISVLSLIPLFFIIEPKTKAIKKSLSYGVHHLDAKLKYFMFVAFVFTLANFGIYSFLLLRAKEITGSTITALAVYGLFNIAYASFSIPFGNLSDKIGRKKVLFMGYILFFLVSLSFLYVSGLYGLIILFFMFGLVYAITHATQKAFVSDFAGKMKGTAYGFYNGILGLASIIGGVIAGFLWDISYNSVFVYTAVISLVAMILLIFVKEK